MIRYLGSIRHEGQRPGAGLKAPAIIPHRISIFVRGRDSSMRILTGYDLKGRPRLGDLVETGFLKTDHSCLSDERERASRCVIEVSSALTRAPHATDRDETAAVNQNQRTYRR